MRNNISLSSLLSVCFVFFVISAKAQQTPASVDGTWLGTLTVPSGQLRIVLNITREGNELKATLDSPDQGVKGIQVGTIRQTDDELYVDVPSIVGRYNGRILDDGNTVYGTWKQGGIDFPLDFHRVDTVRGPNRPQEPKPPFPYNTEEVGFDNTIDDVYLAGTLSIPRGSGPFPALVLVSGSGPQDRDETIMEHKPFLVLADYLTRHGIAVLRYDDRGVGESTGSTSFSTTADFVKDALAGVDLLKQYHFIDTTRIGILGHSEGGIVAAMAASSSDDVAFIVMMAGTGLPGEDILLSQGALILEANGATEQELAAYAEFQRRIFEVLKRETDNDNIKVELQRIMHESLEAMDEKSLMRSGIPEGHLDSYIDMQTQAMLSPWFRYFLTLDPRPYLEQLTIPVLAIIGEKDLQVPAVDNLQAIETALSKNRHHMTRVEMLLGLNHLFQTAETGSPNEYAAIEETIAPEALELISQWISDVTADGGK